MSARHGWRWSAELGSAALLHRPRALVVSGAEIAIGRVNASGVVVGLDVVDADAPGVSLVPVAEFVGELCLHGAEEALHDGVVPAAALATHAADDSALLELGLVLGCCILTATVRVVNQPWRGLASVDGHRERLAR